MVKPTTGSDTWCRVSYQTMEGGVALDKLEVETVPLHCISGGLVPVWEVMWGTCKLSFLSLFSLISLPFYLLLPLSLPLSLPPLHSPSLHPYILQQCQDILYSQCIFTHHFLYTSCIPHVLPVYYMYFMYTTCTSCIPHILHIYHMSIYFLHIEASYRI